MTFAEHFPGPLQQEFFFCILWKSLWNPIGLGAWLRGQSPTIMSLIWFICSIFNILLIFLVGWIDRTRPIEILLYLQFFSLLSQIIVVLKENKMKSSATYDSFSCSPLPCVSWDLFVQILCSADSNFHDRKELAFPPLLQCEIAVLSPKKNLGLLVLFSTRIIMCGTKKKKHLPYAFNKKKKTTPLINCVQLHCHYQWYRLLCNRSQT